MRFADLLFRLQGSTSGETVVKAAAAASGTVTLPAGTTDFSGTGGASQVVRQSTAGGAFTVGQLAASDVTGALAANQAITLSGDIAGSGATAITTTLPNVNANVGTFQGLVVNAKGQVTAATNQGYGVGTLTGVTAGTGLTGGGTTGNPTVNLSVPVSVANGGTNAITAGAALTSLGAAPIASPTFTGTPAAPTAAAATNTTQIATTAYVKSNVPVPMTVPLGGTGATSLPLTAGPAAIGLTGNLLQTNGTIVGPATDATGTVAWWTGGFLACAGAGGSGSLNLIRVNGTLASPTGVLSGQAIGNIYGYGWTSAAALGSPAQIAFTATENWTGTGQGSRLDFSAVPTGSTSAAIKMSLQNGLVVGAPTGGDKGAATINATTVYAAGTALTSDARLKRDIEPLPECLPLVAGITPKAFRWIEPDDPDSVPDGFAERRHWGLMAQDVAAAMAEGGHDFGGHETGPDGTESLGVGDLIAVLWKANQELTARVEALEARMISPPS